MHTVLPSIRGDITVYQSHLRHKPGRSFRENFAKPATIVSLPPWLCCLFFLFFFLSIFLFFVSQTVGDEDVRNLLRTSQGLRITLALETFELGSSFRYFQPLDLSPRFLESVVARLFTSSRDIVVGFFSKFELWRGKSQFLGILMSSRSDTSVSIKRYRSNNFWYFGSFCSLWFRIDRRMLVGRNSVPMTRVTSNPWDAIPERIRAKSR